MQCEAGSEFGKQTVGLSLALTRLPKVIKEKYDPATHK